MIKRLRIKFILIAMLSLFFVLAILTSLHKVDYLLVGCIEDTF